MKPGKSNCGPDHLSRIDSGEDMQRIEETMPNTQVFRLWRVPLDLEEIVVFLKEGMA